MDVGCGKCLSFEDYNDKNEIIGLDIFDESKIYKNNFKYIKADGSKLLFKDKSFDIVVSIGVLEHIHPFDKLKKFTQEMDRVGKSYLVVVPHYYTPLEPHFQMLFWQFYPNSIKSFLIRHFSMGSQKKNSNGVFQELNYFNKKDWLSLFSNTKIVSHNHILFGLIKNYLIYKK